MNGGLTIFAALNENCSLPWYPAYYSGAMAVAATDNNDQRAEFTNYGYWIDISAPGRHVFSTRSSTYEDDTTIVIPPPVIPSTELYGTNSPYSNSSGPNERHQDNSYAYMSGTSMSAPHVSGVAALVISFAHRNGITLSNTDVWNILVNSAECIDHLNPGYEGKLGSGRLNAYYALDYVLCQPKYFENQTVQSDKTINYCHTVLRNVVVSGATLIINSDKAVIEDNVTVQDGAKLIINADNVRIDKNFETELGSKLVINPN